MHQWSRNDKFAFLGVILAFVGLVCALFGQEIRQGLGLEAPQTVRQASTTGPAATPSVNRQPSQDSLSASATPVVMIRVGGDGNTVSLDASGTVDAGQDYEVNGSSAQHDFALGPKQTARVEVRGDGNTIRVAPKLAGRVTIVDSGDGNRMTH